ncbi:hypothetical protein Hanom_Chr13g01199471 [Helianthus anomalus]
MFTREVNENVNLFHDDYYHKAIYHCNNEQPPKMKQISEGSSKERKQALAVIQDDEGFNWNKYIPKEKSVWVANIRWTRQEQIACERINELYDPFDEAKKANKLDEERECFLDSQGNPVVDPKKVDFDALVVVIPTAGELCSMRKAEKDYEEKLEKRIKEVMYASLEKVTEIKKKKKKKEEETIDEKVEKVTEMMMKLKVTAEEAVRS